MRHPRVQLVIWFLSKREGREGGVEGGGYKEVAKGSLAKRKGKWLLCHQILHCSNSQPVKGHSPCSNGVVHTMAAYHCSVGTQFPQAES